MTKQFLTSITALLLTGAAHAQSMVMVLPPPEYDHPYIGELVIIDDMKWQARTEICGKNRNDPIGTWYLACSRDLGIKCIIWMPDKTTIATATSIHPSYTYENLLRHEIGHCNGWPRNHAGGQSMWGNYGVDPWSLKVDREKK